MKSGETVKKKLILILSCLTLVVGLLIAAYIVQENSMDETIENAGKAEHGVEIVKEISYKENREKLRRNLDTILLIGIDSESIIERYTDSEFIPYYNYQQADFLCLMVFDNSDKTIRLVQINRDTMNNDPWLSATGDVGGYIYEQIALSHNSGCGLEDSCLNTCNSVSGLLFGMPIHHYIKISMGAVPVLNDIVGGVTVSIGEDLTALSPDMQRGATVKLMGDDALRFVRARKGVSDGTNISRMRRQRTYMKSYLSQAKTAFSNDLELVAETIIQLDKYMLSDMSYELLSTFANKISSYQMDAIYVPEGESVINNNYYEFHVDKDLLWEKMKEIVC